MYRPLFKSFTESSNVRRTICGTVSTGKSPVLSWDDGSDCAFGLWMCISRARKRKKKRQGRKKKINKLVLSRKKKVKIDIPVVKS